MEYWQESIGWAAIDLGGTLLVIGFIRLHAIIKKDHHESAFERQVIEAWHRVVG